MDEEPLQQAIMAAVNSIMDSKEKINGLITDAALEETGKLPNSAMTLGDINRRPRNWKRSLIPCSINLAA